MDRKYRICADLFVIFFVVWLASPSATLANAAPNDPAEASRFTPSTLIHSDDACEPGPNQEAVVCFAPIPLAVDHCKGTVSLVFTVVRKDRTKRYFFHFLVSKSGVGPIDDYAPKQGAYDIIDDDYSKNLNQISFPYGGNGEYALDIDVYFQGEAQPIKGHWSGQLMDKPRIAAVIVGVSTYRHGQSAAPPVDVPRSPDSSSDGDELSPLVNLVHADQDALEFNSLLTQAYPGAYIKLFTTAGIGDLPTFDHVKTALSDIETESGVCKYAEDDWFIFYFSGHGILVDDGQHLQHYLGTTDFDPKTPPKTGLQESWLFSAIEEIGVSNKLIILDSCFSGESLPSRSGGKNDRGGTHTTVRGQSNKTKFVRNGNFASDVPDAPDEDKDSFANFRTRENNLGQRALAVAAASAYMTAQEGYITEIDGKLQIVPSDQETTAQRKMGHGLFTYLYLLNVVQRMSTQYRPVQLDTIRVVPTWNGSECSVNFEPSALAVKLLLDDLHLKKLTDQVPDVESTYDPLRPMTCALAPSTDQP